MDVKATEQRILELHYERSQYDIGSAEWMDLEDQITELAIALRDWYLGGGFSS